MRTTRKPPKRLFRRPPAGATFGGLEVDGAMATWGEGGGSMLAVVSRIGDAQHVPPGYSTADCHECGKACWISPRVEAMARQLGMRLLATCTRCVGPDR